IAATTTKGRDHFEHRALVTGSAADLGAAVRRVAEGQDSGSARVGEVGVTRPRVAFVFPGQGAQWVRMGSVLRREEPVFADALDECAGALDRVAGWSLMDLLDGEDDEWVSRVDRVQPALWAVMVALARTWSGWGVTPYAVVGHSQGEVAAACVAGILSLDDGARIVVERSAAVAALTAADEAVDSGMLSVSLGAEEMRARLAEDGPVEIAAVNSPRSVVVAGPVDALTELGERLDGESVRNRSVRVNYASHTSQIDRIEGRVREALVGIEPRGGTDSTLFVSSVTGTVTDPTDLTPGYWYRNLRSRVRFSDAIDTALDRGCTVFIEMSPHPILATALEESFEAAAVEAVSVASIHREEGGRADLLTSLADSVLAGVEPDWDEVCPGPMVQLPTYPFQHRRYWLEGPAPTRATGIPESGRRYAVAWEPVELPVAAPGGVWMMLRHDSDGLGEVRLRTIRSCFGSAGPELIEHAATTEELSDADLLASTVQRVSGGRELAGVLLAATVEPDSGDRMHPSHPDSLPAAMWWVVTALNAIARTPGEPRVWAVTGEPTPASGAVWALARTGGLESPNRWGGLVELGETFDGPALGRVLAADADAGEDQVRIRGHDIEGRRLVVDRSHRSRWDLGGCALVVGGTGGIGRQVAAWLASRGVTTIATVSRSGGRAEDVERLSTELAGLGAELRTFAGDVGDENRLREIAGTLAGDGAPVGSVWHLAVGGTLEPLDELGIESAAQTCRAKVSGARALDKVFGDPGVPMIFFSSISSIWGSGRHGAYAGANGYLDALAAARTGRGLPTVSLAWGLWDPGASGAGGRAADYLEDRLRAQGLPFMDPADGLAELDDVLGEGDPLVCISEVDWPTFREVFESARPTRLFAGLERGAATAPEPEPEPDDDGGTDLVRRLAAQGGPQRARTMMGAVKSEISSVLSMPADEVSPRRALRDMGFDSLTALELRRRLQRSTGLKLPASIAFDHPTAQRLVDYLLARVQSEALGERDADPVAETGRIADPAGVEPGPPPPEADDDIDSLSIDDLISRVGGSDSDQRTSS
ncbi:SDR family NAD(P)-dependent oxidoreductase, partial [Dietzia sp. B19]|uniref:SDR family NAD(P)-dependent oxidoreductase n=1 Tax=Dietzia sp. B19 TaxID=1630632 RepID=UPI0015F98FB2